MSEIQAILIEREVIAQLSDVRCSFQIDWSHQQRDLYFCTPRDGAAITDPRSGQSLPYINVDARTGGLFWEDESEEAIQPTTVPGEMPDPGEVDKNFL